MMKSYRTIPPYVSALVSAVAILVFLLIYTVSDYKTKVAEARATAQNTLSAYRSRLETGLYSRIF